MKYSEHETNLPPEDCERCGDLKSERHSFGSDGSHDVTLVCLGCENADLWRLAQSVGK